MLRLMVATLLISVCGRVFAAGSLPSKHVDLSDAGAMTELLNSNPAHYKKIQKILHGLENRPLKDVPRWLRTSFKAKDVSYSHIMLTTSPGQRDLSFVLGETQYYGRVVSLQGSGSVFLIRNR